MRLAGYFSIPSDGNWVSYVHRSRLTRSVTACQMGIVRGQAFSETAEVQTPAEGNHPDALSRPGLAAWLIWSDGNRSSSQCGGCSDFRRIFEDFRVFGLLIRVKIVFQVLHQCDGVTPVRQKFIQ